MASDLTARGLTLTLATVGRRSGAPRLATIGFVQQPGGSLLVSASAETTHWAANLKAEPGCTVELDGHRRDYRAVPLAGSERAEAIAGLILKYGTPAERLGAGPAFRLDPCPQGRRTDLSANDYTDANANTRSR